MGFYIFRFHEQKLKSTSSYDFHEIFISLLYWSLVIVVINEILTNLLTELGINNPISGFQSTLIHLVNQS